MFQLLCSDMLRDTSESGNAVNRHQALDRQTVVLDHHRYDQISNVLMRQASKPQPFINIMGTATHADYEALGFKLRTLVKVLSSCLSWLTPGAIAP